MNEFVWLCQACGKVTEDLGAPACQCTDEDRKRATASIVLNADEYLDRGLVSKFARKKIKREYYAEIRISAEVEK